MENIAQLTKMCYNVDMVRAAIALIVLASLFSCAMGRAPDEEMAESTLRNETEDMERGTQWSAPLESGRLDKDIRTHDNVNGVPLSDEVMAVATPTSDEVYPYIAGVGSTDTREVTHKVRAVLDAFVAALPPCLTDDGDALNTLIALMARGTEYSALLLVEDMKENAAWLCDCAAVHDDMHVIYGEPFIDGEDVAVIVRITGDGATCDIEVCITQSTLELDGDSGEKAVSVKIAQLRYLR